MKTLIVIIGLVASISTIQAEVPICYNAIANDYQDINGIFVAPKSGNGKFTGIVNSFEHKLTFGWKVSVGKIPSSHNMSYAYGYDFSLLETPTSDIPASEQVMYFNYTNNIFEGHVINGKNIHSYIHFSLEKKWNKECQPLDESNARSIEVAKLDHLLSEDGVKNHKDYVEFAPHLSIVLTGAEIPNFKSEIDDSLKKSAIIKTQWFQNLDEMFAKKATTFQLELDVKKTTDGKCTAHAKYSTNYVIRTEIFSYSYFDIKPISCKKITRKLGNSLRKLYGKEYINGTKRIEQNE